MVLVVRNAALITYNTNINVYHWTETGRHHKTRRQQLSSTLSFQNNLQETTRMAIFYTRYKITSGHMVNLRGTLRHSGNKRNASKSLSVTQNLRTRNTFTKPLNNNSRHNDLLTKELGGQLNWPNATPPYVVSACRVKRIVKMNPFP
jgi:hypothetical protein